MRVPLSRAPSAALLVLSGLFTGCGGSTGGSATGETQRDVVLVDFVNAGEDNVPLNRILEFTFSSDIDPDSIGPESIQIRRGPTFGAAVFGKYVIVANRVYFEPRVPGLCDLSDAGFQPGTEYRVTVIGSPEEFAVRNLVGDPLQGTVSASFHTRADGDPELFEDQIPGALPAVVTGGTTPANMAAAVPVHQGNSVTISFTENLAPCTVDETTVLFYQYAVGDVVDGFVPTTDRTPGDPFTWGSGTATTPARRVRSTFDLVQDHFKTTLTLTPVAGEFPDNALLVVQLTNQVRDFGNNPLVPSTFSFTTENRPVQTRKLTFEFDGDVPIDANVTTGEVNSTRSPSRAQGFLLFSGDGDDGAVPVRPAGPDASNGPAGCTPAFAQVNDGVPDDFDPATDVNLDTGSVVNTCKNSTDGSTAVVWEFRTFRVRSGVTVRITGVNPAILLVQGDAIIESGGRILVHGDGQNGTATNAGANGLQYDANVTKPAGGTGTAGGGSGGQAENDLTADLYSFNGQPGYGSPSYGAASPGRGGSSPILSGQGRGNIDVARQTYGYSNCNAPGGGGGGHAATGGTGQAGGTGSSPVGLPLPPDGAGGSTYGAATGRMPTAEAGSGGGGGGYGRDGPYYPYYYYQTSGGGGGAGGGFLDLTASGDIRILGTIDASGGKGGSGANVYYDYYGSGAGGGGGGSGGGIRILTPKRIVLGGSAVISAAGGAGGSGGFGGTLNPPTNAGGAGGVGRIVLEDADSVIEGYGSAFVAPSDGTTGFYRGVFDASRFLGGGLKPVVTTQLIDMGPTNPTFLSPVQVYGAQEDFVAGVPNVASRGVGRTAVLVEVNGYAAKPDGTADLTSGTGWKSVGYFVDSGSEAFPTWHLGTPGDVSVPPDNTGGSISAANGREFCKFRFTFFLRQGMGPYDPGAWIDRWTLSVLYDQ